jgi:hypothetical protein
MKKIYEEKIKVIKHNEKLEAILEKRSEQIVSKI